MGSLYFCHFLDILVCFSEYKAKTLKIRSLLSFHSLIFPPSLHLLSVYYEPLMVFILNSFI